MKPAPSNPSVAALALLLSAGCTVGPDYVAPKIEVPDAFREAADAAFATDTPPPTDFWTELGDPVLDRLVARALEGGLDVREALLRVREARALRGGAAAEHLPTLDGTASYERRGDSANTPFGSFIPDHDLFAEIGRAHV